MPDDKAIVIDFDGTICEHCYPEIGPPTMGVHEALQAFKDMGLRIIIHSVRTASYWRDRTDHDPYYDPVRHIDLIRQFMADNELPYDEICLADKPIAVAYIDDRAHRFEQNWYELTQRLRAELEGVPQEDIK